MSSIRAIARELYRAQQKVDGLQKRCEAASGGEREALTRELDLARRELQTLRRMLDGEKETAVGRNRFKGFGGFRK